MNEPTRAHNIDDENLTRSPMARLESQLWHERARALDNSMEPADRTEIAPTGPSAVLESLCVARARRDVSCTPLEEIHESVVRATEYLRLQLSWCCDPAMEDRLVTLHNDIDDTLGAYALCAERNVSVRTELRNHLAWLLGDSRLEGAFDYDSDDYQDDYEDTWDDETAWVKGSTTTPTTATGGVQFITTPPQPATTPPHVFRSGSPAPPEAVHVDAGKSAMTLNYPADGCADSTADDRASADHRADFYCCCVSCCTNDIIPPQYEVFNDDLLMVELDDADACSVDVRKSERCDSDAGYDDDDDGLLADHVPARAQTVATGADVVSDRADSTADDRANPTADDYSASAADERADPTADDHADSTADDRADSNADDRADPISDDRADPTTDAPLCADSPTRRVTTDRRPGTDLSIESTTDPALNRHSTAIFLPTTTAGVKGFRCHDRAVSASDVRADSTAEDRADSTADDHAVPISEDRADSTADDRADFIADDHAVAAADDRADSIVYAGADHTADEQADSTADNRADPNADDRADPSADDRADPTADAPLCADPPARRVATDGRPGTDLPVESTTDPALNRHSTAIFLSTMTAGVKGFRCHDRAVFTADDRDVSADNRADSTTNGPADSTSDDRADSAADDHPVSAADERADSNADDRADFTADDRADSNADDRADPSADDRAESTADAPLCANPPERRVTTDCRPGNDMLIESTTDPTLNRHSTSIFLPTTSTGVKGFHSKLTPAFFSSTLRMLSYCSKQGGDPYVFGSSAMSQANDYFFARKREKKIKVFFFARQRAFF